MKLTMNKQMFLEEFVKEFGDKRVDEFKIHDYFSEKFHIHRNVIIEYLSELCDDNELHMSDDYYVAWFEGDYLPYDHNLFFSTKIYPDNNLGDYFLQTFN